MSGFASLFAWHDGGNASIADIVYDPGFVAKLNTGDALVGMKPPVAKLKNAKGRYTDFLFSPSVENIVSERLKNMLEARPDTGGLTFHPMELTTKSSHRYFMVGVGLVDAFDWDRSIYELYEEPGPKGNKMIRTLTRMEIDPAKTGGRGLFMLEGFVGTTYVSAALEAAFVEAGITGYKSQPLRGHG